MCVGIKKNVIHLKPKHSCNCAIITHATGLYDRRIGSTKTSLNLPTKFEICRRGFKVTIHLLTLAFLFTVPPRWFVMLPTTMQRGGKYNKI